MAAVLSLFLVGVLIGGLGVHVWYATRPPGPPPPGPARGERMHDGPFGPRLMRTLDLTDEQRERIEAILEESRREAESLREEIAPRIREQAERTRARLAEVLTPEQLERFDALMRRHGPRGERFLLGGGREHGPGPPRERRPPP